MIGLRDVNWVVLKGYSRHLSQKLSFSKFITLRSFHIRSHFKFKNGIGQQKTLIEKPIE